MVLLFTVIDREDRLKSFSWWFGSFEYALDVLSAVHQKGNRILKAEVVENHNRTQLPIDAFDGIMISNTMQALESQWQALLCAPVSQGYSEAESIED